MNPQDLIAAQAAAFRRLAAHLQERSDVQNIDLMILAGFCRNCLSNWLQEAANEQGIAIDKDTARAHVYGMPFNEWKQRYQTDASAEQLAAFEAAQKAHPPK
jgi:uncharacterized protein